MAKDILNNGLISPIAVQKIEKGYKLLAGERRLKAINLLGKNTIEATVITVKDEQQALHIEIDENIKRKSFTREETVLCGLKLEKIYRPLAEERQKEGAKTDHGDNFPTGRVDDIVAKELLIGSGKQYSKEKYIVENKSILSDEEFINWNYRNVSTNQIFNIIKARINDTDSENNKEIETYLQNWKKSFKKTNAAMLKNINAAMKFQNEDIRDDEGYRMAEKLIDALQEYEKQTKRINEMIDSMHCDIDGKSKKFISIRTI